MPKWKPPPQSAVSVTVMVSSPEEGSVPVTTTLGPTRSGEDVALQVVQKAPGAGAGDRVTISDPPPGGARFPPPLTIWRDEAIGVNGGEGADAGPVPTALVALTVRV